MFIYVYESIQMSVYLHMYLSTYLTINLYVSSSVCQSIFFFLFIYLSAYQYIYVYLCVCLPICLLISPFFSTFPCLVSKNTFLLPFSFSLSIPTHSHPLFIISLFLPYFYITQSILHRLQLLNSILIFSLH